MKQTVALIDSEYIFEEFIQIQFPALELYFEFFNQAGGISFVYKFLSNLINIYFMNI